MDFAKYENRLRTFNTWPRDSAVHIKDLVEAGFSYTGETDFVFCYCCQLRIGNWKDTEEPLKRHETENASCPYLAHRRKLLEAGPMQLKQARPSPNHPITSVEGIGLGPKFSLLKFSSQSNDKTKLVEPGRSALTAHKEPRENSDRKKETYESDVFTTNQREQNDCNSSVVFVDNCQVDIDTQNNELTVRQEPQSIKHNARRTADFPKLIMPQQRCENFPSNEFVLPNSTSPRRVVNETSPQLRMSPVFPNPQHSPSGRSLQLHEPSILAHSGSNRSTPEPRDPFTLREYSIPGIDQAQRFNGTITSRAADMRNKNSRLNTFLTWPQDVPVQPLALADAGFYYLRKDDGVRCYKCNISLRNWKDDDIPWTEHAKWSPNCPLVKEHTSSPSYFCGGFPEQSSSQMPRTNRANRSPLSAGAYALPSPSEHLSSSNTSRYSTMNESSSPSTHRYSTANQAQFEIQSGFRMIGSGNVITESAHMSHGIPNSRTTNRESSRNSTSNRSSLEIQIGSLSNEDVDSLLDAGFTLETISKVQKLCFQNTHGYFDSVETIADAIMHFRETGNLQDHPIKSNPTNNVDQNQNDHAKNTQENSAVPPITTQSQAGQNEEHMDLKRELDRVREMQLCKICMDEQVGVVFLPCGHLMTCPACSVGLEQCPLCRATIESSSRIYLS